jgi:predicted regulator of Ras-like GTPase activity (Roadblock/LC7/MglB family)
MGPTGHSVHGSCGTDGESTRGVTPEFPRRTDRRKERRGPDHPSSGLAGMVKADWSIYEEDYWAINSVLEDLLKSSNSGSGLLIDRTGQLITNVGTPPDFDVVAFASLCAADFEANNQLAKLIGEKDFSTLYHQGIDQSMYLARIARDVILVVLFDKSTTLGLVRLRVKRAVEELSAIVERLFEKLEYRNEEYDASLVDQEFTDGIESEIDKLFAD